jgi:hypothetical protein
VRCRDDGMTRGCTSGIMGPERTWREDAGRA